jgi:hypothetical protein
MEEADTLADDIAIMAQAGGGGGLLGERCRGAERAGLRAGLLALCRRGGMQRMHRSAEPPLLLLGLQARQPLLSGVSFGGCQRAPAWAAGPAGGAGAGQQLRPAHRRPVLQGMVAASGTSLELKGRYGAGYTLSLVLEGGAEVDRLAALVLGHVPGAELLSAAAAEASFRWARLGPPGPPCWSLAPWLPFGPRLIHVLSAPPPPPHILARILPHTSPHPTPAAPAADGPPLCRAARRLPRGQADRFAALLRQLDCGAKSLGVASYGLSVTTLEEVFLRITEQVGGREREGGRGEGGAQLRSRAPPPSPASAFAYQPR